MKVLCIDKDAWPENYTCPQQSLDVKISNGKTYEVSDIQEIDGFTWYQLPHDIEWFYWEGCFIGTSDIDEKEFERNYNKELA